MFLEKPGSCDYLHDWTSTRDPPSTATRTSLDSVPVYDFPVGRGRVRHPMNSNLRAALHDILSKSQPCVNLLMFVVP
jgi:hypothetical protein